MPSLVWVLLLLVLVGAVAPVFPYSRGWGYGPSTIGGLIVVILLVLALTGRL